MMWLDPKHGAPAPRPFKYEEEYVTLRVKSARIPDLQIVGTKYHISVASWLDWQTLVDGMQHGTSVVAPADARNLPPKQGDRILLVDIPVLKQVPWLGELNVNIALFSVVEESLAGPVLDYLVKATDVAGFGFAGPAKIYASLLKEASDAIFGTDGSTKPLTGMSRNFLKNDLQAGYLLLSDAPADLTAKADIKFDDGDKRIHVADKKNDPFKDYAYMVLEFLASDDRTDWAQFAELKEAWEALRKAYVEGATDAAGLEQLFKKYERLCLASPDLVPADAKRKAEKARDKFLPAAALAGSSNFGAGKLPDLPPFEEMA